MDSTQSPVVKLTADQLRQAIVAMTSPNNEAIKEATITVGHFLKQAESLPISMQVLVDSTTISHKQCSAIIMKHSVVEHLNSLDVQDRHSLREKILEIYFREEAKPVLNLLGHCIGIIAEQGYSNNDPWEGALVAVSQASQQPEISIQLKGVSALTNILYSCAHHLIPKFKELAEFLYNIISGEEPEKKRTRSEALKGLACIIANTPDDQISNYKVAFKAVINKFDHLVDQVEDDEMFDAILDMICDLAEKSSPLLKESMKELMNYLNSERILMNIEISDKQKLRVLNVFHFMSQFKVSAFSKNTENLKKLIGNLIKLVMERDEECIEQAKKGERSFGDEVLDLIKIFSKNIPKKKYFPIIKQYADELIKEGSNLSLKIMYWIYSAVIEGLADLFKPAIKDIIETLIKPGVSHTDSYVRNAALKATLMMSEYLMPEIASFHEDIIPIVVKCLEDSDHAIINQAIFCIDVFVEGMEPDDIVHHIEGLVEKFIIAVQSEGATYDIRGYGINALGSIISAAKDKYAPYFEKTFELLKNMFISTHEHMVNHRGKVIGTLGRLVGALSEKNPTLFATCYKDIHAEILRLTMEETDDYDLIEGCFTYHSECVTGLKEAYAREVCPMILPAVENIMSVRNTYDPEEEGPNNFTLDDGEADMGGVVVIHSVCLAQAEALHYLGTVADNAPTVFQPMSEMCLSLVADNISNEDIHTRRQAAGLCKMILTAVIKSNNNGVIPAYKKGLPAEAVPQTVANYFKGKLLTTYVLLIQTDSDEENVRVYIEMLKDAIIECGPFIIKDNAEELLEVINDILTFNIECFDKGQEEGDEYESSGQMFIQICDLIIEITNLLKESSLEFLRNIMKNLWSMVETGGALELEEFIGAFCDFSQNCPSIISESKDHLCKLILASPETEDEMACRNAIYCLGLMLEIKPDEMRPIIPKALGFFKKTYEMFDDAALRDNVVAAVCRAYIADNSNIVPVNPLISSIVERYPFQGDKEENKTMSRFSYHLLQRDASKFKEHATTFIKIAFTNIMNEKEFDLTQAHKDEIKSMLNALASDAEGKSLMEQCALGFDQEKIQAFLN